MMTPSRTSHVATRLLPLVLAGVLSAAAALALWYGDRLEQARLLSVARAQVSDQLGTIRAQLQAGLTAPLLRTRGLVAQVIAHGDISPEIFARIAEVLLEGQRNVRNFTLSRGTEIAMVHPRAGNESILGIDYRNQPHQWPVVEQAISSGKPLLQGPVDLIQGGTGLIGRVPIWLPASGKTGAAATAGETFFGLASVVIDIPGVLADAGLTRPDLPIAVAIEGLDLVGATGDALIFGDRALFSQNPITMALSLPYGVWRLAAIPRDGWQPTGSSLTWFRFLGGTLVVFVAVVSFGAALHLGQRHRLEEALRQSSAMYHTLFARARAVMLLIDPESGQIVDANEHASRFYGYSPAILRQKTIFDFNTLPQAEVLAAMARSRAEQCNHFTFRHRLADGAIRDVENYSGPVELHGRTLLLAILHDITDRKRTEAELQRLYAAVEQCPSSIVITDTQGAIEYVNTAFTQITGYSHAEVYGQNPRILKSGETTDSEYQALWQQLLKGQPWSGVFHNKRKDGSFYWEQAHISPVFDVTRQITHYVGVKENITARREMEAAILEANRRLDAQAQELTRANAELEQFAYVASHDLRQPLRMVNSYLALITRKLQPVLNPETTGYLKYAIDGAKRMDALIMGLLEISRVGRISHPFEPVSLAERVATTLQTCTFAIAESQARVTVAPDLPTLPGDPAELQRLLDNLISNALKYRAPERAPEIDIGWRSEGEMIVFWVCDNGIGIAPDEHDRAFAMFQRLVPASAYEGTGIGLAVCRKIVEHHRGRIWIESSPGEGTCFLVALPAA